MGSAAKLDSRDRVFGAKRELANDKELETDNKLENYCATAESKKFKFESDSIMNQKSEIETETATQTEEFV